jgi:hypothetical protein
MIKERHFSQALVVHAYNPSYSGGKDQEDPGSKLDPGKQFERPYLKKPITRKSWWSGSSGKNACLRKYQALSSNLSVAKRKRRGFIFHLFSFIYLKNR